MIDTVLFDMDGSLLGLDTDAFAKAFVESAGAYVQSKGYDGAKVAQALYKGILAIYKNDGSMTNKELFLRYLKTAVPELPEDLDSLFSDFYQNGTFDAMKEQLVSDQPASRQVLEELKRKGYRVAVATNSLFAMEAQLRRLRWAGFEPEEFELVSSYDDFHFAKPHKQYYLEFCEKINAEPSRCLMVGNDVLEDAAAMQLGMDFYLLTGFVVNRKGLPSEQFKQGSMDELLEYVRQLPELER